MLRLFAVTGSALIIGLASASAPAVSIRYNPTLDNVCALFKGPAIEAAQQDELHQRIDEFRSTWNATGPDLLATTETLTGKSFPDDQITAYLTLCSIPSQSRFGISVNMRYAVASFTDEPVPFSYKAGVLFHEILHDFITEHRPESSPLLEKYSAEPWRVRNHLHLLALMKAVYLSRELSVELAEVIEVDSMLPGGFYRRAWEIVNDTDDTHRLFVAELTE